ncbi:MAG TPA: 23S rRNA (guanosine(2251)-2'-O)-methyltransferase RlmB [Candidatus Dorea gallistercoris]|uniref:23S rRNA (Guanosine(2251)-2'-O)-methyltransferase RlmB n=1 Tax=Candidatus Dorea gallistercoris TaxID=2838542 RepID=A0A9D1RBS6_9FIRM|nr:23S rRNA (guanosine(2251)-2'-O)-methyltransferase RlmB [Candidatus Dorea gallistercoris]
MITSTANARVKRLVSLMKKRRSRDQEEIFLAEGPRMFRETPLDRVREVYLSEGFRKKEPGILEELKKTQVSVEILSDSVFSRVSDTQTPQGVLAVVERREADLREMTEDGCPLLLILDGLQDPGNLGTILRTGEGAGVTGVILSSDCVDIYNPKTIRSTMGSIYRVPVCRVKDITETLKEMKEIGICTYAAHLEGQNNYDQEDFTKPCAFLIGNEGNGLREEVAEAADRWIQIPMKGQVESLNAAIAAAVLMFEAGRQRRVGAKKIALWQEV